MMKSSMSMRALCAVVVLVYSLNLFMQHVIITENNNGVEIIFPYSIPVEKSKLDQKLSEQSDESKNFIHMHDHLSRKHENILDIDEFSTSNLDGSYARKKGGPAIAMLISNSAKDMKNLKNALESLDKHMHHDEMMTPVLFFNEGNLEEDQKLYLRNITKRAIHFPTVDFNQYPDGFDPKKEKGNFKTSISMFINLP